MNRIELLPEEAWRREELQKLADILNTKVTYSGELEGGFEQCCFTPKAWAKNEQKTLFEEEEK